MAAPVIGPDNVLYLIHAALTFSVGGSIVAVGPDVRLRHRLAGRAKASGLRILVGRRRAGQHRLCAARRARAGRQLLGDDILAVAPDSTVHRTTTIIEP